MDSSRRKMKNKIKDLGKTEAQDFFIKAGLSGYEIDILIRHTQNIENLIHISSIPGKACNEWTASRRVGRALQKLVNYEKFISISS